VPRRLQETGLRVSRALGELWQELGRSPTVKELATRLDLQEEEILEAIEAMQAYSTTSLEAPVGDEGPTHAELLTQDDESLELLEQWASVAPKLQELPTRERRILYLRFFKGLTQSEIAEQLGISQMHVSRLLSQTLVRLREVIREP
jgi:RNA polymerase sigma-B factor